MWGLIVLSTTGIASCSAVPSSRVIFCNWSVPQSSLVFDASDVDGKGLG